MVFGNNDNICCVLSRNYAETVNVSMHYDCIKLTLFASTQYSLTSHLRSTKYNRLCNLSCEGMIKLLKIDQTFRMIYYLPLLQIASSLDKRFTLKNNYKLQCHIMTFCTDTLHVLQSTIERHIYVGQLSSCLSNNYNSLR